jgi:hypothetical protein
MELRHAHAMLQKLNLSRNALSSEIPHFLDAFPWLRLLELSYNSFTDEIPVVLFDLCLRYISLVHNDLADPSRPPSPTAPSSLASTSPTTAAPTSSHAADRMGGAGKGRRVAQRLERGGEMGGAVDRAGGEGLHGE